MTDKVKFLVGSKNIEQITLPPYDNQICNFLVEFSKELENSDYTKKFSDLKSLSFWCRKNNILNLKKKYLSDMTRVALGIVFHITPSNIPTNFAYSLIFGLLTGNTNIVKVPSKKFIQIKVICEVLKKILKKKKHNQIKKMIKIIKYHDNLDFSKKISMNCNARLIWGGDKTINHLKSLPTLERNRDLTFPDRYSLSILNSDKINKLNSSNLNNLVNSFYNDTYLVDQNACSSPHLILWHGKSFEKARNKFWEKVNSVVYSKYSMEESSIIEKYTKLCSDIISLNNIKKVKSYNNNVHTILLNNIDENIHLNKGKWGFFYEYEIENPADLKKYVNSKYQTLTYFGFAKNQLKKLIKVNQLKGIDRIVPIGRALDIDLIWDGYDINNFLTRIIEIK